jgi:hypothetical protein
VFYNRAGLCSAILTRQTDESFIGGIGLVAAENEMPVDVHNRSAWREGGMSSWQGNLLQAWIVQAPEELRPRMFWASGVNLPKPKLV